MKYATRLVPALALAIVAAVSAPAMARDGGHRDRDDRHGRYDDRYDRRYDDRRYDARDDDRYDRYDRRYDDRRYRHHRDRVVYVNPPPRVIYRPGPPVHAYPRWSRGVRYDTRGYAPTYVVHDYRDYRDYGLYAPPRGYHWRRDDRGDFILVAVATGLIASVIFR
jgi:Ni/Co efflux regulator RcnB